MTTLYITLSFTFLCDHNPRRKATDTCDLHASSSFCMKAVYRDEAEAMSVPEPAEPSRKRLEDAGADDAGQQVGR